MKRWQKALAWILGLPIALIIGLAIWRPEAAELVCLAILGSFTNNMRPPAFARDAVAGGDWMHWREPSVRFAQVLRRRFPIGSNENQMRMALKADGFEDRKAPPADCKHPGDPTPVGVAFVECPTHDWHRALDYYWGTLPCGNQLTVLWDADRSGHITKLDGFYGQTCL